MGLLADKKPEQGQRVSGILVKRNFNYHILSPCDLSNYMGLAMSTVKQTQAIYRSFYFAVPATEIR